MKKISTTFIFSILVVITGCAGGPRDLAERHQSNGVMVFHQFSGFEDYLTATRDYIASHNGLLRSDEQLRAISPFEMVSKDNGNCQADERVGVLLMHGLTDTPFLMRDIADSLLNNNPCLVVRAIVLPGHATVPGDLLEVEYEDWIKAADYGINSFADAGIHQFFIAGFSTGAALALNHAIHSSATQGSELKGLLLFSPAVRINSRMGFITNWHYLISWADPKRAWFDILDDKDFAKYESFPKNAADQIHLLTTERLDVESGHDIHVPLFTVVSQDDDTIHTDSTIQFFKQRTNGQSQLLVYRRGAESKACDFSEQSSVCVRGSVFPAMNVMSLSHTAIPVAATNAHYGIKGDYKSCYHYLLEEKPNEYQRCLSDDERDFVWGEKSLYQNGSDKPVRRISFNPDFDYMAKLMNQFIANNR